MDIKQVFFFESMLTPKIIVVVYWFLLISAVLSGLGLIFGAGSFFGGLAAIIGGAVGARIFCELLIVAFKINEALQDMRVRSS
jgi:hypothetical protein